MKRDAQQDTESKTDYRGDRSAVSLLDEISYIRAFRRLGERFDKTTAGTLERAWFEEDDLLEQAGVILISAVARGHFRSFPAIIELVNEYGGSGRPACLLRDLIGEGWVDASPGRGLLPQLFPGRFLSADYTSLVNAADVEIVADGLALAAKACDFMRASACFLLADVLENENRTDDGDRVTKQIARDANSDSTHSADFRSVVWCGTEYSFTPNQAACIRVLWNAWTSGAREVGLQHLIDAADSSARRMNVIFRKNAAWGAMVVGGRTKGTYRLATPGEDSSKQAKGAAAPTLG